MNGIKSLWNIIQSKGQNHSREEFSSFLIFHKNEIINMAYQPGFPFAPWERDANGEYKWKNKEIMELQNRLGGTEALKKEFARIKLDPLFSLILIGIIKFFAVYQ